MTSRIRAPLRRSSAGSAVAAAITALAVAGCGSKAAPAAAAAPACLPAAVGQSAKLAGVPVDVSPTPGSGTADPHTQISFLGAPASRIRDVTVLGARSGRHPGRLRAYSQGDGASYVPNAAFTPGEHVTVHAVIDGHPVAFGFGVDTPFSTAGVPPFPNPAAEPGDYQTFDTLPGVEAPVLTVTVPDRDPAAGDILTTNGPGAGRYGLFIYTPQGQLVWADQLSGGLVGDDLNEQTYAGHRDLTFWEGRVPSLGFGQGEDYVMSSRYQVLATVRAGNGLDADLHDFEIAPDDIAYITAYNPIHCNLSSQGGPRNGVILDVTVQEIDMRTGLVRWEWHALDHVPVSDSETSPPASGWDWFHLNSIDPEPDGNLLISARNTWAVYQIQAGTGRILWTLGGEHSSFVEPADATTRWQHDARMLPDGDITIYDDESPPAPADSEARGVTIALDLQTHRARLVSALPHPDPPLRADSQGNMQTLADGNTVVGFGGVPYISEFAKDGSLLFDAHLPIDMIFYRAYRYPWSGQPLTPPAVVANLNNVSETIVHMSWNGATDVARWRVLAGSSPRALEPRTTVSASGFETSTILSEDFAVKGRRGYGDVAVQALSAAGRVLGTSRTVAIQIYAESNPVGG